MSKCVCTAEHSWSSFSPTAQAWWWYILRQSTCSHSVGGKGDEREKQEVTFYIKLPFIESKQQCCSVYLLTCVKTFFSKLNYWNNLRKVLTNCNDSKCHRLLNVSSAVILIVLLNYLCEDVQLWWYYSYIHFSQSTTNIHCKLYYWIIM